jgi:hypothetical protein
MCPVVNRPFGRVLLSCLTQNSMFDYIDGVRHLANAGLCHPARVAGSLSHSLVSRRASTWPPSHTESYLCISRFFSLLILISFFFVPLFFSLLSSLFIMFPSTSNSVRCAFSSPRLPSCWCAFHPLRFFLYCLSLMAFLRFLISIFYSSV